MSYFFNRFFPQDLKDAPGDTEKEDIQDDFEALENDCIISVHSTVEEEINEVVVKKKPDLKSVKECSVINPITERVKNTVKKDLNRINRRCHRNLRRIRQHICTRTSSFVPRRKI